MDADLLSLEGKPIPMGALTVPKARRLAAALTGGQARFASFVECRRNLDSGKEAVVFDVDVEQPTKAAFPIAAFERIAVEFDPTDQVYPSVWAIRADFPRVPHLT
jgi:xanthine/CO dehydrogenase XdhC/CoxF family maturation factor